VHDLSDVAAPSVAAISHWNCASAGTPRKDLRCLGQRIK